LKIPLLRSLTLWFTPRIELLPISGQIWPPGEQWEENSPDFQITLGLILVNAIFLGLALWGAWLARRWPGWALLIVFLVVRTLFFTHIETIEPRYVLECFPAVIALGAQVFARRQLSSTGSG
jgi:hypothetical protein